MGVPASSIIATLSQSEHEASLQLVFLPSLTTNPLLNALQISVNFQHKDSNDWFAQPSLLDKMPRSLVGYILEPTYGLVDRLHLNFFRIHVLWFIINPIFWSIIFYVSSGQVWKVSKNSRHRILTIFGSMQIKYSVSYIDSLFLCTSSHTVTGLSTVNLSTYVKSFLPGFPAHHPTPLA